MLMHPRFAHDAAAAAPRLRTLGALTLADAYITRPKPLLLLAFLAHEGPTDRDRLARLFFGATADPRDALSTTIRRLHGLVVPVAPSDPRLATHVTTDALQFLDLALRSDSASALRFYRGPFVQGLEVGIGAELEEWIVSTRESLASVARDLHLAVATTELRRRRTIPAWKHARAAVGLTEAFALEPQQTEAVLLAVGGAGLPVPDRWWSTVAPGLPERPPTQHAAGVPPRSIAQGGRRRVRSSRLDRPRRARRASEQP